MVKLVTWDEHVFDVASCVAGKCETLKHVIEDGCDGTIPVANVECETLEKVLLWCKRQVADSDEEETNKWEQEYVDSFTTDELYNMIMAANYLNAKPLVNRLAKKVADIIRGKHPDQIRTIFGIKNDFESEVYERMVAHNAWALNLASGSGSGN